MLLSLRHVTVEFPQRLALNDVSLVINEGDKAGLVGPNGAGKTSLLRVAAGIAEATSGVVDRPDGVAIGYLPQEVMDEPGESVRHYLTRMCGLASLAAELEQLYTDDLSDAENLVRLGDMQERYERLGGFTFETRLPDSVRASGLQSTLIDAPMIALSGGQRARVALAGIMLDQHDLLLLDEPTNNLDIEGIDRLERFINQSSRAYLCVSHDRGFLRRAMRQILRLDKGSAGLTRYGLGYDEYLEALATETSAVHRHYAEYVQERARLQGAMAKRQALATTAGRATASDNDKVGWNASREKAEGTSARAERRLATRLGKMREPDREVVP